MERFLQIIFLPFSFWSSFSQCECISTFNGSCICLRPSSFILPSNYNILVIHLIFTCFVSSTVLFGCYTFELHNFDFFISTHFLMKLWHPNSFSSLHLDFFLISEFASGGCFAQLICHGQYFVPLQNFLLTSMCFPFGIRPAISSLTSEYFVGNGVLCFY